MAQEETGAPPGEIAELREELRRMAMRVNEIETRVEELDRIVHRPGPIVAPPPNTGGRR